MTNEEAREIITRHFPSSSTGKYDDLIEALKMALKALKQTEWIPCSEGLPYAEHGESDSVLCYTESGLQKILYFNGGCWCHPTGEVYEWNFPNGHTNRVVAWMPKPQPYTGR